MKRETALSADLVLFSLRAGATQSDLKRAYRRAALALHPDQNPDPAAASRFRILTDAYRRLEAQLPPAPPRRPSLRDRALSFVADARTLLKRWPADRWTAAVDGLPAIVWLASAIEVVAGKWPAPGPVPTGPTVQAVSAALEAWTPWIELHPPASRGRAAKELAEVLTASEARLKALDRPRRR